MKKRNHEAEAPAPAPAPEAAGPPAPTAAADEAAAEIARLAAENERLLGRLLETTADLDNQAKRFARERQVVRDEITLRVVREILPALDNLDRLERLIPQERRDEPFEHGVLLTRMLLLDKLRALGVEPIEAVGRPFDPFLHEAMTEETTREAAPGTVLAELAPGYRIGGQLVRATRVRVARAPAEPETETKESAGKDDSSRDGGADGGAAKEAAPGAAD
jgi:molecular chaperone GrpE